MDIAILGQSIVKASHKTTRHLDYRCPECGDQVTIAKGEVRVPYFKHKADSVCRASHEGVSYETALHRITKESLHEALLADGNDSHLEYHHKITHGVSKRQADVFCKLPREYSHGIAFEIQHSNIAPKTILQRQRDWSDIGITVAWVIPVERFSDIHGIEIKDHWLSIQNVQNDILYFASAEKPGYLQPAFVNRFDNLKLAPTLIKACDLAVIYFEKRYRVLVTSAVDRGFIKAHKASPSFDDYWPGYDFIEMDKAAKRKQAIIKNTNKLTGLAGILSQVRTAA